MSKNDEIKKVLEIIEALTVNETITIGEIAQRLDNSPSVFSIVRDCLNNNFFFRYPISFAWRQKPLTDKTMIKELTNSGMLALDCLRNPNIVPKLAKGLTVNDCNIFTIITAIYSGGGQYN